jgi:hypothetical protein
MTVPSAEAATDGGDAALDWVPAPPFGTHVMAYEFFPDSMESTFDSISTAYDTVTWRGSDYSRVTAYGDGWQVPVWTEPSVAHFMVATRIEKYMTRIGRLGAGLLSRSPEHGIAILTEVPGGASSLLGATYFDFDRDNRLLVPILVVLVYDPIEDLAGTDKYSTAGIVLHEFGHVIPDPLLKCTESWRDALLDDREAFPSLYARYNVSGYDPRIGTSAERRINYWDCVKYSTVHMAAGDTIPSGEDVAESFAMWWLTRCKKGDEPMLDRLLEAWFPNRLAALDRALDPRARTPYYVPSCPYPIVPIVSEDGLQAAEQLRPDTIPDGITAHTEGTPNPPTRRRGRFTFPLPPTRDTIKR